MHEKNLTVGCKLLASLYLNKWNILQEFYHSDFIFIWSIKYIFMKVYNNLVSKSVLLLYSSLLYHNRFIFQKETQNVDSPFIYLADIYCKKYEKSLEYFSTLGWNILFVSINFLNTNIIYLWNVFLFVLNDYFVQIFGW